MAERTVGLRVLVLACQPLEDDAGARTMVRTLDAVGAPYDVVDVSTGGGVTEELLYHGDGSGRYNGVVLTVSNLDGLLTHEEWTCLHDYERAFGVREAVLSGFPTTRPALDYGVDADTITRRPRTVGRWTPAARALPGVRAVDDIEVASFGFSAEPRTGSPVSVSPLLSCADEPSHALISVLRYPDGREVLLSTVQQPPWCLHAQLLAYSFVHFATRGVHLGSPRVRLTVHVDDLLVGSATWDPATAISDDSNVARVTPSDLAAAAVTQRRLVAGHDTLADFRFDLAFNGVGTFAGDPLSEALSARGHDFRFLNHTYSHADLDTRAGLTHSQIVEELTANLRTWDELGLPGRHEAAEALVTGGHTGLSDGDVPYPAGCNPALVSAMTEVGVRYVAGDSSMPGQHQPSIVPGCSVVVVPRNDLLYYDTWTPEAFADAYRHRDGRLIAAREAQAGTESSLTYEGILERESRRAVARLLGFDPRPYFSHQANLRVHDGAGSSLLSDWLEAVLHLHAGSSDWPVENPTFAQLGEWTAARVDAAGADVEAWIDRNGEVRASASTEATIELTGLDHGVPYGPVRVVTTTVGRESQVVGRVAPWNGV